MTSRFIISHSKYATKQKTVDGVAAPKIKATYYYVDYFGIVWDKALMMAAGNALYLMSLYVVYTQHCYDTFVYGKCSISKSAFNERDVQP